jgi:hypothetical protein
MFGFLRQSALRTPSAAMGQALQRAGLPLGLNLTDLGVLEKRGSYSGRRVTFIRVLDRRSATEQAKRLGRPVRYPDLDTSPELVVRSGHVEQDGTVVLHQSQAPTDPTSVHELGLGQRKREPADRAAHPDDTRFVVPRDAAAPDDRAISEQPS